MPNWLIRAACGAFVLLLCTYAHAPSFGAGPTGGDARVLVDVARWADEPGPRLARAFDVDALGGHPLAVGAVALSGRAWGDEPSGAAPVWTLRLENLVLVLAAALGVAAFVRRLLAPWMGSGPARAAALASALILSVHPIPVAAVATVSARGDLLALALGAWACAAFLKSRQERRFGLTALAALLTVVAGASSDLALLLPVVLAGAEASSARRSRPNAVRARTALTTLVVFGACALAEVPVRALVFDGPLLPSGLTALADRGLFVRWAATGIERLGALALPANAHAMGLSGLFLAGLLALVALHPALLAARSAPRLWGWLAVSWLLLTFLCELQAPRARVHAGDVTHAATLAAAATVLAVGLGVTTTAVSDARRYVVPLTVAFGFAILAHANGLTWRRAVWAVTQLRADAELARQAHGRDARLVVLDPQELARGVDALAGELEALLDPVFAPGPAPREVRTVTSAGFVALAREPEIDALRSEETIVLLPNRGGRRTSALLPEPRPSASTRTWFREPRSPSLDLESIRSRALEVRASPPVETANPPGLAWRTRGESPTGREGRIEGVWTSGGEAPTAIFDLSASLDWLLAGRVVQLWSASGWSRIRDARVLDALPAAPVSGEPEAVGDDWRFALDGAPSTPSGGARWVLGMLALDSLEHVELEAVPEPGAVLVPGAVRALAELSGGGGAVAWGLELRSGELAVARSRGRMPGSP